ncbi:ATP-binding protein [Agathobaculum sp. NTUH-O15-33]|uniref:tRNA 2-thiocytidine biosynthesis TtcA family protein n=1 Tax=Agathobaculum sp. NTUH-O15-33 TaxID=3079302 RepID=UPI00295832FB|nr:ATP-binding protein [Agathobaculum sp. NTUH-O15-33]WNX85557.1 ATP-binding protein [Agathobaculum sp. NTUH-O15-33]
MQKMLSYVRRAVDHYHMIEEGDRIAVGVSGGKDSLALLVSLAKLRAFYPKKFEVVAITLKMGYEEMDFGPVQKLCDELAVPYIQVPTQIKQVIFDIRREENPCALCAKMRRGALHEAALAAGCKKVALGHHFDDVVETYMLSLFYEGRISCFQPVTFLDRCGITLIRPLLYTPEHFLRSFAKRFDLPIVHNPCPADGNTKRQEIKELLQTLEKQMPGLRERIFGAMQRYPLKGWAPDRAREPKKDS